MARAARKQSEFGYMHLIVRGIGRQLLFEEDPDYRYYLSLLKRYSIETGVRICAFCLMENHVHLLTYDKDLNIPLFMKKTGISYTGYFNHKYQRSGHLFQDRYKSEVIESEDYLLTVFRYILNNPQKAHICAASDYKWSSYHAYNSTSSFVDTRVYKELFGNWNEYAAYIAAKNEDECMEFNSKKDDEWAKRIIQKTLGLESGTILQSFDSEKRNSALRMLKSQGLSVRQIERLTGINRGAIQRA